VSAWRGVLAEFAEHLPVSRATPALSLGEGNTPLIPSSALAQWAGVRELFLKCEGSNPTGSFKDRGMVVAVAKALERGAGTVICASTGNTAASAAAYAARAGIAAVVVLPRAGVAAGKLLQAFAHGARVVAIDGGFDQALDVARALAAAYPAALVNSVNPDRIAGQQSAAYEIWNQLGAAPDILALPVGNGGNITAYWAGFQGYGRRHAGARLPRMVGAQAEGAAPLVRGRPVEHPETAASAIRIGRPATWDPAVSAVRESQGAFIAVTDQAIGEAQVAIARLAGIFCELASAASVAGLKAAVGGGQVHDDVRAVCILTGHGLKDPDAASRLAGSVLEAPADIDGVARVLGWR